MRSPLFQDLRNVFNELRLRILPYSTHKSQYIMAKIVWERKKKCSTLDWDCRHDFFYPFLRKISCSLVLEVKNNMKFYFPVKYQVLCELGFPLNSERCFWAVKRTFIEIFLTRSQKLNYLCEKPAKSHYWLLLFNKKQFYVLADNPGHNIWHISVFMR